MFKRVARLDIIDKEIKDLRMVFNIEKSLVGYPNLGNILIYNLSENDRNRIEEENQTVELFAGYEDTETVLLFKGDIVNVVHLKQGVDWISEIFAADGIKILETATINKSLAAGTTVEQVYDELTDKLEGISKGVTKGLKNCLSGKTSLLRALIIAGNVKDWLKQLSKDCGFEYSINEGVIETLPTGGALSDDPPVIINQGSGMIGSPERTEVGINVTNFLLPALKLGRTVRVESLTEKINIGNAYFRKAPPVKNDGIYRMDKLIHEGDTHGNKWQTNINARVFN